MEKNNDVLDLIENFCKKEIIPHVSCDPEKIAYPKDIIKGLSEIGLFGINIPAEYGGSTLPISQNLEINRILAKYWLGIPAMYGTHLRSNQYFLELATDQQKSNFLPKMASGEKIAAHAFHEKGIKDPNLFKTKITKESDGSFLLNGEKEWATNAEDANFIIVVAKKEGFSESGSAALIIERDMPGVNIVKDHFRSGMKGISLNRVSFSNVNLQEKDFIGGHATDATSFISDFRAISSLNFSARCVGIAENIVDRVRPYLLPKSRSSEALPVISYKWSEVLMILQSMSFYFEGSVRKNSKQPLSKSEAHRTKAFCSSQLQILVAKSRMLAGGTGYASDDYHLIRQLNDAGSLQLIDTPDDTLLTWTGLEDVNG